MGGETSAIRSGVPGIDPGHGSMTRKRSAVAIRTRGGEALPEGMTSIGAGGAPGVIREIFPGELFIAKT